VSGHNEAVEITNPTLCDPRLKQFKAAGDPGQQVVEVVGDTAGELAYGLRLLRWESSSRDCSSCICASRRSLRSRVILAKPISWPLS
jgi:hypothetical protein